MFSCSSSFSLFLLLLLYFAATFWHTFKWIGQHVVCKVFIKKILIKHSHSQIIPNEQWTMPSQRPRKKMKNFSIWKQNNKNQEKHKTEVRIKTKENLIDRNFFFCCVCNRFWCSNRFFENLFSSSAYRMKNSFLYSSGFIHWKRKK